MNQYKTQHGQTQQRFHMEYENAKRSYEVEMHQLKQNHDVAIVQLQQQVQYQLSRANSLQQTLGKI